jgi:hypothetical protein
MSEEPKFFSTEHEILHELGVDAGKAESESLRIDFLGGRVPVLTWRGRAALSELSERGRELLSGEIEKYYTRPLVPASVDLLGELPELEEEDVDPPENKDDECCGGSCDA